MANSKDSKQPDNAKSIELRKKTPGHHATTGEHDAELRAQIVELAKQYAPEHQFALRPAAVMVAALFVGPNEEEIARVIGESPEYVAEVGERLRLSRLWDAEQLNYSNWGDGKDRRGLVRFLTDLAVAQGLIVRTEQKQNGEYVYRSLIYQNETLN